MERAQRRIGPSAGTIIGALLSGLLTLLILVPASGIDSDPPVCRAMLSSIVPCEGWVAPLAAIATAVAVGIVLWWTIDRRRG